MALDRDVAEAAMGMDLPLDRMNVGDGGEVEILAEDERYQFLEETLAGVDVASHGPRLDVGGALPVLATAFIVVHRRIDREGQRRRALHREGPDRAPQND